MKITILLAVVLASVALVGVPLFASAQASETRAKRSFSYTDALDKPIPVMEFSQTPVKDVLEFVATFAGVNIIIDRKTIEQESGKSFDEFTVTLKLKDIPVRSALKHIMRLTGLEYELQDGAVWVTVPGFVKRENVIVAYDITDLLYSIEDYPSEADFDITNGTVNTTGNTTSGNRSGNLFSFIGSRLMEMVENVIRAHQ